MTTLNSGISFAATAAIIAVAAAAAVTPAVAEDGAKQIHCYGVNTCKGTSDCKTAHNDCKGMNECKGHGFKAMTVKQCKAAGGSLTEPK
ncbi:hypothetical protein [Sphingobium subterraneum]|uniref:Putative membrane protein n=1 Tax=Sphingobium subterraneum TaxID=627688 RepID=A0A841J510_9SPHN|nr:hypothetical protein [Sphingobium subterraneum]MBB6124616.1 putative membrane protein [Sphingobium subterraneum]